MFNPIPLPRHSPWVNLILVIRALLSRELATRFGQYQLGFIWMLLEPLISVLIIGVVLGSIAERTVPDIPYPFFVLNGKLLLNLFTGSLTCSINAMKANKGLLIYPNVRALHPFLARYFYELLTTLFSFTVFCIIGVWMGVEISLGNLGGLAACYLITWLMGCGFGLIFAVAAAHFKEMEKVMNILLSPLLFISAVMFPITAMSPSIQRILLNNPLVHVVELSRKSLFPFYHAGGSNLYYPFSVAVVVLALGLTLFHNNRNFMSQQ